MKNSLKTILQDVKQLALRLIFEQLPKDDIVVFLFGSMVQDYHFQSSDIDIGIFSKEEIDHGIIWGIRNQLEEKAETLRKIDLIDFSSVTDKQFIKESLKEIEIWHQTPKSKILFQNFKRQINVS